MSPFMVALFLLFQSLALLASGIWGVVSGSPQPFVVTFIGGVGAGIALGAIANFYWRYL